MVGPWENTLLPVYLADPVNRQHPLNRGRVFWHYTLPGLDGTDTWYDLMGLLNLPLTGFTGAGAGWRGPGTTRPGGYNAVNFTSTDTIASGSFSPPGSPADITLAAWINPTGASGNHIIMSWQGASPSTQTYYDFFIDGSSHVIHWYDGSANQTAVVNVVNNAWNFVVASRLSTVVSIWSFNEGTVASNGLTVLSNTGFSAPYRIGCDGSGQSFAGLIDDVSFWNRALSNAEIGLLYQSARLGYPGLLNRVMPLGAAAAAVLANPAAILPAM